MFTPPTRKGVQRSTIGFGEALAGRGYDINNAIGAFLPLVPDLGPVARNLASPTHRPGRLLPRPGELHGRAGAGGPDPGDAVRQPRHDVQRAGRRRVPSLQNTISETPPTFEATIANAPVIRPFLTDTAALFAELRPGVATLPQSAPVLAERVRHRHAEPAGDGRARPAHGGAVQDARRPTARTRGPAGPRPPDADATQLRPPLAFLTPVQSTCNYVTLFLRNIAERAVRARQPGRAAALRADRDRRRARA